MGENEQMLEDLRRRVAVAPRRPMGDCDAPKAYPPATATEIADAETKLGFQLPRLLSRLYAEVANGGFGPGHGLFPIGRGHAEPRQEESIVQVRNKLAIDPQWPTHLLPICNWGCAIWSCLDCRTEDGSIITLAGEEPFADTGHNLRSWLQAWLAGRDLWNEMFEPGPAIEGVNPFTKKPIQIGGQGKPRGRPWP